MKAFLPKITILLCLAVLSLQAQSRELPSYYPDQVYRWFTIDKISLNELKIILNDLPMNLSPNTKVHSLNTEFSSLQALKPGMKVFFSATGGNTINEIWILPDSYSHHVMER
ncbi:MAG TPA: hypothetical protein ENJ22_02455 [Gammaproteobacteria bacterium]|nr:hypothetical protein [Gammaproteobacteria bacterium]